MANLKQNRIRIYVAISLLLLLDLGFALYLLSPLRQRPWMKQQALHEASIQLQQKQSEVAPLLGMDGKLKKAQTDLDVFDRSRLPSRPSSIAAELGKLAVASGVQISGARYQDEDSGLDGFTRVNIEAGLEGGYLNTVKFINALERDKMFFILNGITLDEQQGGSVRLRLRLQTFRRNGPA